MWPVLEQSAVKIVKISQEMAKLGGFFFWTQCSNCDTNNSVRTFAID